MSILRSHAVAAAPVVGTVSTLVGVPTHLDAPVATDEALQARWSMPWPFVDVETDDDAMRHGSILNLQRAFGLERTGYWNDDLDAAIGGDLETACARAGLALVS